MVKVVEKLIDKDTITYHKAKSDEQILAEKDMLIENLFDIDKLKDNIKLIRDEIRIYEQSISKLKGSIVTGYEEVTETLSYADDLSNNQRQYFDEESGEVVASRKLLPNEKTQLKLYSKEA
jgi:hypothetical protein